MKLPALHGLIRRRILVNYRVDPDVAQRLLRAPFRPKLVGDAALAGVCLVRLERIRPAAVRLPLSVPLGWSSENAAHRFAVVWTDNQGESREGVYIPRRDTGSLLNHLVGGRAFPAEQAHARFRVHECDGRIDLTVRTGDRKADVHLEARPARELPPRSCFASLTEASRFFAAGEVGYSPGGHGARLDGVRLRTRQWRVEPLDVLALHTAFFADQTRFPPGSVAFDSALIMRNIPHEWEAVPDPRPECC
jgi:hypothetical protein